MLKGIINGVMKLFTSIIIDETCETWMKIFVHLNICTFIQNWLMPFQVLVVIEWFHSLQNSESIYKCCHQFQNALKEHLQLGDLKVEWYHWFFEKVSFLKSIISWIANTSSIKGSSCSSTSFFKIRVYIFRNLGFHKNYNWFWKSSLVLASFPLLKTPTLYNMICVV